jgi:PAS domain S-box-containing protein
MTRPAKSAQHRTRRPSPLVSREEDLHHLADALPQLVWVARPDGYIEHYNRSCLDYTGLTHDELLGWGWQRVLHPDEVEVKLQRWAEALRTGNVFEIEYRLRQFDGRYRWHLGRAQPFRDASGRIVRWFGTSTDIDAQKQAEQRLLESQQVLEQKVAERIQDLAGRLIVAQEAERKRIARDLHDDISQQLAGLSIALSGLKRRLGSSPHIALEGSLTGLQQRTFNLVESVRQLSHDLHPGVLQQVGLTAALESHCAEFQKQHGIDVIFFAADELNAVDPDAALCLYRAAQETLRNVAKHAGAHHVQVALSREHGELTLTIVDDGSGFDAARVRRAGGGLGLVSIEERARLLHGNVRIASGAERGTAVRIAIPTMAH